MALLNCDNYYFLHQPSTRANTSAIRLTGATLTRAKHTQSKLACPLLTRISVLTLNSVKLPNQHPCVQRKLACPLSTHTCNPHLNQSISFWVDRLSCTVARFASGRFPLGNDLNISWEEFLAASKFDKPKEIVKLSDYVIITI